MVSAFVAETPNRKKNPFLPARKKHPYLLALANPHARITLGTRRYGFCVTSSWQYAFLIGPFVPHDLYTRFWLVHAILALYYYYYQVWIYTYCSQSSFFRNFFRSVEKANSLSLIFFHNWRAFEKNIRFLLLNWYSRMGLILALNRIIRYLIGRNSNAL